MVSLYSPGHVGFVRQSSPVALCLAAGLGWNVTAGAATLDNDIFSVTTGDHGEINSLRLIGDDFPTNYVLSPSNAPSQDTDDHQWLGELIISYRLGGGAWQTALTNRSADARSITSSANAVTVTYENSADPEGVRGFRLIQTYELVGDALVLRMEIVNTSGETLEIGDLGLPMPWNEYWFSANDRIYETRVMAHSFIGYEGSYITVQRPSGIGPYLLVVPDATTGAKLEYQDHWTELEHPGSAWAQGGGTPTSWPVGLSVYYVHSNVIKSTNQGYLESTSLVLGAGESHGYAFRILKVGSEAEVKDRLVSEGLVDVTVVPSLALARDMTGKFALRTQKPIRSVVAQYPAETTLTDIGVVGADQHVYSVRFDRLGQNDITVNYGTTERTVLQFYVMEEAAAAFQRHATFMVEKTQVNDSSRFYDKAFDDWMMNTKSRRDAFGGYMGWGDDWGLTHGTFLAEKNAIVPVASEVQALDDNLEVNIWNMVMAGYHDDYLVHDWLNSPAYTDDLTRGYAYPHVYNTYFAMYRIAKLYPNLIRYRYAATDYLLRAYNIMNALYANDINYNFDTGLMGEQTTPDIIQALRDEGFSAEADRLAQHMEQKYATFSSATYPYGSEYSFDNTGEEAVYTLAKMQGNAGMMGKINAKSRACRGQQPVWYYYSNPTTLNGEGWWQFQYTVALAGFCMDDWLRHHSASPEEELRLTYAAKLGNLTCINSGQIDADPANLGAVSWTYQAQKGNFYQASAELYPTGLLGETKYDPATFTLHNGWRFMAGEADLGLWGALRILSSDVAIDPIFGATCYGCDVVDGAAAYTIVPRDGVQQRLNLISEKLYVWIDRNQVTRATLNKAKDGIELSVRPVVAESHPLTVSIDGLTEGTYDVSVDDTTVGTVTASQDLVTRASVELGANPNYVVRIGSVSGVGGESGVGGATGVGGDTSAGGADSSGGATGEGGSGSQGVGGGLSGTGGSTAGEGGSTLGSGGSTPAAGGATPGNGGSTSGSGGSTPASGGAGGSTPGAGGSSAGFGGQTPGAGGLMGNVGGATGTSGGSGDLPEVGGSVSGAGTDGPQTAGAATLAQSARGGEDSGCGCRVPKRASRPSLLVGLWLAIAWLPLRRGFRRRSAK